MLSPDVANGTAAFLSENGRNKIQRFVVWVLLFIILLRFSFTWANTFAGTSLPRIGSIGFTAIFATFSILHAAGLLGWRRSLLFLLICFVASWCFETAGVATGLVYGAYHYG